MKTLTAELKISNWTNLYSPTKVEIHFLKVAKETEYISSAYSPKIQTAASFDSGSDACYSKTTKSSNMPLKLYLEGYFLKMF